MMQGENENGAGGMRGALWRVRWLLRRLPFSAEIERF